MGILTQVVQEAPFKTTALYLPLHATYWSIHTVTEGQGCMWNIPEGAPVGMFSALQGEGD